MFSELRHRDPVLFWIGAAMLLGFVVSALLSIGDQRLVLGINPWIKPMKFYTSVAMFLWTVAWFMPETTSARGRSVVRWVIGTAMIIEMVCITYQAGRGVTSHFNAETPFDAVLFAIMGVAIGFNTLAMVLFLFIIRRDTPPNRAGYIWGIRLGLILFLLASAQGGLIVSNNAHTIGAPDGGPGLPFVNWSTEFGDLRIAHFIGMHALQGLPLLGFLTNSRGLIFATSAAWLIVMGGALMMALQGRPLLAL
ncbi:MAG TPA: hypothetical protein VEA16_00095 [Vicinamibacterales bacterium]|nr:hypothetical protein [Vicinamibacterales bacterium]